MTVTDPTVGQLVAERPGRARVFEELGIDYCCGGRLPLAEACARRGLDPVEVRRRLDQADAAAPPPATDWASAPLAALCEHIVETHHEYLRRELPRLGAFLAKLAAVHGERHPELGDALRVFGPFADELRLHLVKEERVLFPLIEQIAAGAVPPSAEVLQPIRVMEADHDGAGAALAELRRLTAGYSVPADGCNTYRAAMAALAELEADLHTHVHKENNILVPRVERLVAGGPAAGRP
jgi:regulator of cell morphogenesis and NO signaling